MRNSALPALGVAAVVVVAVLGAGFFLGSETAGAADDSTGERTISVTAQGSADAEPDRAVVRVAVVAEGEDPSTVRDDLATGAADLRQGLSDAGVDEDDLQTAEYEIREPRRPPREDDDAPAYRGIHAFEVTVDDVDEVGAVVDAAASAGADVQHVRFTLSEEKRADLRDEALENAMDDADRQATTLAQASDLAVTGVVEIDATDRQYRPVEYDAVATESADAGGGTAIESGEVSVTTSVRVTYNATAD